MKLDFSWINLLILFGAVQGLIFTIILLVNKKHPGAKFLAVFMLVFSYNGFETFNWSAGLDQYIVFFELFSFILIYAAGPSLYLYIASLLHPEEKISTRRIATHYGIVAFQFAYRLVIVVLYGLWRLYEIQFEVTSILMGIFWLYAELLSVLVFLGYLWKTMRLFRKADPSNVRMVSKDGQRLIRQWIQALLISMTVFGAVWLLTVLTPYFFEIPFGPHYYPIEIGLVFFIYWIAFTGYHRTKIIYLKGPNGVAGAIASSEADRYMTRLKEVMENEKLYLDPELNLEKVAICTGIPAKTISGTLNQYYQRSFTEFINEYRVREVKEKLLLPKNQFLTISGIALESGFNSQATFQRVFKNSTGVSPREYLNQKLEKTA